VPRKRTYYLTCADPSFRKDVRYGFAYTKSANWKAIPITFGTILNPNGENPKVIQELLRHANVKVTMDTYVKLLVTRNASAEQGRQDASAWYSQKGSGLAYWTLIGPAIDFGGDA